MTDFEEYIRQSEPHKREKGYAWQTAIGLQAVDGLKTSDYLRETARQHIEGDITIEEVKLLINRYYESKTARKDVESRTEEADKVSTRITELLSEQSFTFSPLEYIAIHRWLFEGIYPHAGTIRDYNITKKNGYSMARPCCMPVPAAFARLWITTSHVKRNMIINSMEQLKP